MTRGMFQLSFRPGPASQSRGGPSRHRRGRGAGPVIISRACPPATMAVAVRPPTGRRRVRTLTRRGRNVDRPARSSGDERRCRLAGGRLGCPQRPSADAGRAGMPMNETIWFLKRCPLFERLSLAEGQRLEISALARTFGEGDHLLPR